MDFNARQVQILERIASGTPLVDVLTSIVAIIEDESEDMLCSILRFDAAGGTLHGGVGPRLPASYLAQLEGAPVGPTAGSCGAAAYTGHRVIVEEIATHPNWVGYRELVLPHGLRACWSTPVLSQNGEVLGTFAMYYREPRGPAPLEISWVDSAVHLASIAITRDRARETLIRRDAELRERIKELTLLHRASRVIGDHSEGSPALLSELVALIPSGFRAPERVAARVTWSPLEATGSDWRPGEHRIAASFEVGDVQGTIEVAYHAPPLDDGLPPFLAEEQDLIRSLAEMLEARLRRTLAETELREREGRIGLLHEMSEVLRTVMDPEEVLPQILGLLGRHLRVARCVYAEVNPDGDRLMVTHDYTDGCASIVGEHRLSDFDATLADLLRGGPRPVAISDVEALYPKAADQFRALGVRAFMNCSLVTDGHLRALISVHHPEPREWTRNEIAAVQSAVERCWATLEKLSADARLRQSEALLRVASEVAKLGGWNLDLPEMRIHWSDEVRTIHEVPAGWTPTLEEAIDFYAPEFRESIREAVARCIDDGTPFDIELQILTRTGKRRWVRAVGKAERDSEGAIIRVQGAFQDISDRRVLEDQFHQAQKLNAIGQLAAGVAHDFNNLLSVILSYSTLLADDLEREDPMRESLDEIRGAGERAAELTKQLLVFSRKQVLQPRHVNLNQVIARLEKMLRRLITADIELAVVPGTDLGTVLVDPGQMEQVLTNLVVNARDAMPQGGKITIESDSVALDADYAAGHVGVAAGPYVVLAVTDTGIGMDQSTRERIFEPFFTTKEEGRGTGLGLSTVFGIVKQSGGTIEVYSELGKGTTMKIYIPCVEGVGDGDASDQEPAAVLRGSETILLVDDDKAVRTLASTILRRAGYHVLDAAGPGDALLICESHSATIHLLLTDVVMPGLSGQNLAARLRPLRPDMRVLYMSGYPGKAVTHHGILDSDVPFISKPITPRALAVKVREVLDAPRGTTLTA